jgi:UrcA family protein
MNRNQEGMTMIKTLVLAAAAFAAVPALAQEAPTSVSVAYGDLNLSSPHGAAVLKARVKAAARQICGVAQAPGLTEAMAVSACRTSVLSSAEPQMNLAMNRGGSGSVVIAASR